MGWSPGGFAEKFLHPLLDASTASSVKISCITLHAFNLLALAPPVVAGLVAAEPKSCAQVAKMKGAGDAVPFGQWGCPAHLARA